MIGSVARSQAPARTEQPRLPPDGERRGAGQGDAGSVVIHLSPQARALLGAREGERTDQEAAAGETRGQPASDSTLTKQEKRQVEALEARDVEVRAHEAAHAAAAGGLGGRPSFEYVTGPDGRRYAVGGEVSIDTSPGRTPEETIAKARTIRAAATAPASPSAQDMAVASAAARMEAQAQSAMRERRRVEAGPPPGAERATTEAATSAAAGRNPGQIEAEAQAPVDRDPDMTLMALVREQVSAQAGAGHQHLQMDCGFCKRSVGAYG